MKAFLVWPAMATAMGLAAPASAQSDPSFEQVIMGAVLDFGGAKTTGEAVAQRRNRLLDHVNLGGLLMERTVDGKKIPVAISKEDLTAIVIDLLATGDLTGDTVVPFVRAVRAGSDAIAEGLRYQASFEKDAAKVRRFYDFVDANRTRWAPDRDRQASWPAQATMLKQNSRENQSAIVYHEHRYTPTGATMIFQGDPPDYREIEWTYSGLPASLSPGQEFTVRVTGRMDFRKPGADRGANASAGLVMHGFEILRQENAYFYQGASRPGIYVLRVPQNATKVVLEASADNNLGTFARYCYGACS